MGFFGNLFGTKRKLVIEDPRFGAMFRFSKVEDAFVWAGKWETDTGDLEFFVHGTEHAPNEEALGVLGRLVSETKWLEEAKTAVIDTLRNAEPDFPFEQFEEDMELVAVHIKGVDGFRITYQQRRSPFYHFHAEFEDGKAAGVSIDS